MEQAEIFNISIKSLNSAINVTIPQAELTIVDTTSKLIDSEGLFFDTYSIDFEGQAQWHYPSKNIFLRQGPQVFFVPKCL